MKRLALIMMAFLYIATPAHAVMFTITEGTYTPAGGGGQELSGEVEIITVGDIYGAFSGSNGYFNIDGFEPFHTIMEHTYDASVHADEGWTPLTGLDWTLNDDGNEYYSSGVIYFSASEPVDIDYRKIHVLKYDSIEMFVTVRDMETLTNIGTFDITATTNPVPEPATMALLVAGLSAIYIRRRYSKSEKA